MNGTVANPPKWGKIVRGSMQSRKMGCFEPVFAAMVYGVCLHA
jgi:hypothetical protein